ncbi:MAG: lactate utilization protein B [Acidobacteriota bacterium]
MIRIKPQIADALHNAGLQANLRKTIANSIVAREAAVREVEDWEALRSHARQVKDHTLGRLAEYLEQFEANLIRQGAEVIWAEDGAQAAQFLRSLIRHKGVRRVVKSKTMLGEEIRVNEALEQDGVEVVETDLGEYIVQLCGEAPFHIVTPAMHKSRQEVADLFAERFGMARTEDVAELTATARRVLRNRFLQADLGITGANFGIAETGTIVIVENEGNARLTVSLPRIHVVLMGIEKMLPRLADLPVFLKLLTRSATGQRISSYVNLVSGPRRADEPDGPEELYVILVDNGRSRVLADRHLRQTLRCIRCGACLNACPVYQRIGGHAYRSVYQGPIGAVLTPQLLSAKEAPEHPFASSLCGACYEVCPVAIEIPELLLRLRRRVQEEARGTGALLERMGMRLWSWSASSPTRFGWATGLLRWGSRRLVRQGRLQIPVPPFSRWAETRDLPSVPAKSFRELMQGRRR